MPAMWEHGAITVTVLSSINWTSCGAQPYEENIDRLQSDCRGAGNPVIMYGAGAKEIQHGD